MILDTDLPNEPIATSDAVELALGVLLANGYARGFRGSLMPPESEQWLTIKEASEQPYAPPKRQLKRLCARGTLVSVLFAVSRQKQYYIEPDSLAHYIDVQRELIEEIDGLTDGGLHDPSEGWLYMKEESHD